MYNNIYIDGSEEETGMTSLTYGKIQSISEVDAITAEELVRRDFSDSSYLNIKVFFVAIDYKTSCPDKYIYNGIN